MSSEMNLLNNTTDINYLDSITTSLIDLFNNNTNSTNDSSLILPISSSLNKEDFSWKLNLNFIILLCLGLMFVIFLISMGIWYWCNRTHRLHRQNSLPFAINDLIERKKIEEKEFSSSPRINRLHKVPPVLPRPTAYTTVLGTIEYRSNL